MTVTTGDPKGHPREDFIIRRLIRLILIILLTTLLYSITFGRLEAEAPVEAHDSTDKVLEAQIAPPEPSIEDLIIFYAKQHGVDAARALRVARCESGLDPLARNPNSSAKGVFQFIDSTWASVSRMRGTSASVLDAESNIDNALWLARKEGWHHWVCR